LKRLAALLCLFFSCSEDEKRRRDVFGRMELVFERILLQGQKDFIVSKIAV